jgi:hypothetical protein
MIAPTELTQNYNPNQPIETLFQQIQDARAFVVAGGKLYGSAMSSNVECTCVRHRIVPQCMSGLAIKSDCGKNVGAV